MSGEMSSGQSGTGPLDTGHPSIWIVGSTMVDMVAYATRIPAVGETLVGDRFDLGFGGKGANQAVMCARLGADVTMVNAVGDDPFGSLTIENLRAEGINVEHVITVAGQSTGAAPIWVERDGSNRILVIPGANAHLNPVAAATAVAAAASVDVVVGQLEIPQEVTAAAFRAAKARAATTILNPAPAALLQEALLAVTDWLVPNEREFEHLSAGVALGTLDATDPTALRAVQQLTRAGLVVTLGSAGAVALSRDGRFFRVSASAVTVVDTTGAGDAFVGGLAFGLASGMELDFAVRAACALASDSVQRPGTQKSFPTVIEAARIVRRAAAPPS
jgi:ribokinase